MLYFGTVHGHGKRLAGVSGYVSLASIVPGASFLGGAVSVSHGCKHPVSVCEGYPGSSGCMCCRLRPVLCARENVLQPCRLFWGKGMQLLLLCLLILTA